MNTPLEFVRRAHVAFVDYTLGTAIVMGHVFMARRRSRRVIDEARLDFGIWR